MSDEALIGRAIELAGRGRGLVSPNPMVGAVAVAEARIVGEGWHEGPGTPHAEVMALRAAGERAHGGTLVVTLEPCAMCAGAIVLARVDRVVVGAPDPKAGFTGSLGNLVQDPRLNHRAELTTGVRAEACGELLRGFFRGRR